MATKEVSNTPISTEITEMQILTKKLNLINKLDSLKVEWNEDLKTNFKTLQEDIRVIESNADISDEVKVEQIKTAIDKAEKESRFPLKFDDLYKSQEPSSIVKPSEVLDKSGASLTARMSHAHSELMFAFNLKNPVQGYYNSSVEMDRIYRFINLTLYLTHVNPECLQYYFTGSESIHFNSGKLKGSPIWVAANTVKSGFVKQIMNLNAQLCCQVQRDQASEICTAIQNMGTIVCPQIKLSDVHSSVASTFGSEVARRAIILLNSTLSEKVTLRSGKVINITPQHFDCVEMINAFLQGVAQEISVTPEMLQKLVDVNLVCIFCTKKLEEQKSSETEELEEPEKVEKLAEAQNLEMQIMLKDNIQGLVMQLVREKGLPLKFKDFEKPRWK